MPVGDHRAALERRAAHLRSFPQAPEATVKVMISRLFLRFPSMSKATEEQVTSYARDLMSFPLWAIAKGLNDIVGGLVLKAPDFPPSSLVVRAAVEKAAQPIREELAAIDDVLNAQAISDALGAPPLERRRELAQQARDSLHAGAAAMKIVGEAQRNMRLASSFDDARERPTDTAPRISDEALATTGRSRPREDVA